jgi:hypothetical protein
MSMMPVACWISTASVCSSISAIVARGADVKTTQELVRHSTPALTMNTYAKRFKGTERVAFASLPKLIATVGQEAKATGTDAPVSP